MVTKPTGRPRGRPPKARPPPSTVRRKVGRPPLALVADPDRYAIGLLDGMLALRRGSERDCSLAVVVWFIGVEGNEPKLIERAKGVFVLTNWKADRDRPHTRPGANAATLDGRAATLRRKRRRYRKSVDLGWRSAMGSAFQIVLACPDPVAAKRLAILAASVAGEEEFAREKLWPMIDARFSG